MKGAILLRVGVLGLGRVGKLHFLDALHMNCGKETFEVFGIAWDRADMHRGDARGLFVMDV